MLAVAALATHLAIAGEIHDRELKLAGTTVIMPLDDSWKQMRDPNAPADTVVLESKDGRFRLMITPEPAGMPSLSDDAVRDRVAQRAEELAPASTEKKLVVKELRGAESKGYYFAATGPSPKPGEYRYLNQGIVTAGGRTVAFTGLYNEGGEKDAAAALAALRGVRLK
jgi:hypothetical protein